MPLFKVKIKTTFSNQGVKGEAGMQVELTSKKTSVPNLLSAGKQEIIDAFKRTYGITFNQVNISNNYLEVTLIK